MTKDVNPLEPRILEFKFYARGVGPVLAVSVSGSSDREELLAGADRWRAALRCIEPMGDTGMGAWAQSSNGCPLAGGSAQVRLRWCSWLSVAQFGLRPRPPSSSALRRSPPRASGRHRSSGRCRPAPKSATRTSTTAWSSAPSRCSAPPAHAPPALLATRPRTASRAGRGLVVVPAEPGLGSEARGLPRSRVHGYELGSLRGVRRHARGDRAARGSEEAVACYATDEDRIYVPGESVPRRARGVRAHARAATTWPAGARTAPGTRSTGVPSTGRAR